ncbi:MAG TPA: G1 family glutamic endopeptidase [Acidimicrobiales bacterium]|nr:G1 family glutamic endopeptidase [Acidimicrobiales bacterium]
MAVLLAAVAVVMAKPLTAGAMPARTALHAGRKVAAGPDHRNVPLVAPGVPTSPNWSGYVAYPEYGDAGPFTEVSAEWIEPAVTCPQKDAWTLFWVGFDGWPSGEPAVDRSVEQGGTSAQCVDGVPHYSAFYEMFPSDAVQPMFPVSAGDQIYADVVYSATTSQYLITVTDLTSVHADTETEVESCPTGFACPRSSAEWIAESPSHFGTTTWFPLANYKKITFTGATAADAASSGPISDAYWEDSGIERMAGPALPLAEVSPLRNSGYVFSDIWRRG